MVDKNKEIYYYTIAYKEITLLSAIGRIIIGMLILLGLLVIVDIFVYLGATGYEHEKEAKAAYKDNYTEAYNRSYAAGYEQSYYPAYDNGYARGSLIGSADASEGQVGSIMELRIPTYAELREFLAADTTDSNQYINDVYNCFDYAAELNNAAEAFGLRAAYVSIRGEGWAHALVAFDTLDDGLVYIEPQSDRVVDIVVGRPYPWWMAGASSSTVPDSPIEEIIIIW